MGSFKNIDLASVWPEGYSVTVKLKISSYKSLS